MLAGKFTDEKAAFPCFVQPKIDGVRCLFDGRRTWTRNGKPHIQAIQKRLSGIDISGIKERIILDGELYSPGKSFQEIVSAVKRNQRLTHDLRYYVFDLLVLDEPSLAFEARLQYLKKLKKENINTPYTMVSTIPCTTLSGLKDFHKKFVNAGNEGLIYRSPASVYRQGRSRSALLKYKTFVDDEFTIIGFEEGQGKNLKTPIFICETFNKQPFKVNMKGPYDYRRQMWSDRKSLIGKSLTIKFQDITDNRCVPRFPIGIAIRDYECGLDESLSSQRALHSIVVKPKIVKSKNTVDWVTEVFLDECLLYKGPHQTIRRVLPDEIIKESARG